MSFEKILEFEKALAKHTGAPFAIMTDNCTNALELCFRHDNVTETELTQFTYLSVYQMLNRLNIKYNIVDERWLGEYEFKNTRIWDSARLLAPNMYRPGCLQCLSFGYDKPLNLGWGGAILTDDERFYNLVIRQRYDGRDLTLPWQDQALHRIAYHMRPTPELAEKGLEMLPMVDPEPVYKEYPNGSQLIWLDG
jgi:dTDP-4-amino-4,6-dideoxygalactose transaminase